MPLIIYLEKLEYTYIITTYKTWELGKVSDNNAECYIRTSPKISSLPSTVCSRFKKRAEQYLKSNEDWKKLLADKNNRDAALTDNHENSKNLKIFSHKFFDVNTLQLCIPEDINLYSDEGDSGNAVANGILQGKMMVDMFRHLFYAYKGLPGITHQVALPTIPMIAAIYVVIFSILSKKNFGTKLRIKASQTFSSACVQLYQVYLRVCEAAQDTNFAADDDSDDELSNQEFEDF
ncbi:hypothetical protein HK098_008246 [Nowakowskiella sp. JEL0407]|nr:hypothetical protein HK098_008246 [Nowakowskiella sp. JEL0407]